MKNKSVKIPVLAAALAAASCSPFTWNESGYTPPPPVFTDPLDTNTVASFPGAEGFGAVATGGRGGKVVYVTNLNPDGPGSLNQALGYHALENNPHLEKRYILFKVSGIVSGGTTLWDHKTHIEYGDFTLAGQTSPGGIVVGGFMTWRKSGTAYDQAYTDGRLHFDNFIIRHLRSRPAGLKNALDDALRLEGSKNVMLDHLSLAWAEDEAMQIAKNRNITVQNSLLAETLGEHWDRGGVLVKYSSDTHPNTRISFHHNTFNRIGGRLPQISPHGDESGRGMEAEISYNLLWDPGSSKGKITATYITTFNTELQKDIPWWVHLNFVGNQTWTLDTAQDTAWKNVGDISVKTRGSRVFTAGNTMNLYPGTADKVRLIPGEAEILTAPNPFPPLTPTASADMRSYMLAQAGAFPRDAMDRRLMGAVAGGTVSPLPCNEKGAEDGHLFDWTEMPLPPLDSDDDGMPDDWEIFHGLNPLVQDHNGREISSRYYGHGHYDNLEVYLQKLSDHAVSGTPLAEGTAHTYPLSVSPAVISGTRTPGGTLRLTLRGVSEGSPAPAAGLGRLLAPFASPAPAPRVFQGGQTSGEYFLEVSLPQDVRPGTHPVLISVKDAQGNNGYRVETVEIK